ncbi:MAG: proline dehydrogenase family protein [bacterium]|nr:proline dehydrogenase family protein [bacterium]
METSVNLNNNKTAYKYKKNNELRFTYYIFKMLQYPKMVKVMMAVANNILKYHLPFKALIKSTVFKVFCSGEDISEALATVKRLDEFKVKSVLDYVSEAEKLESVFNKNGEIILENIMRLSRESKDNSISVKLTGLEDQEFFKKINKESPQEGTIELKRYHLFLNRIEAICAEAEKQHVLVYIDAEERCTQDVFDRVVETMMERHNKKEAIVFNTLQMYLTDRLEYLQNAIKAAEKNQHFAGIKLVRGAYAERERLDAKLAGIPSPVYSTKQETDDAFDKAIDICLSNPHVYTCIATHNEKSTRLALNLIEKYKISDHYKKVKFSQLLGMSDNLTFNLAAGGFNASKYLPYGEVKKAIPYLIRRAEENSSISGQMSEEVTRLENELSRRKTPENSNV